MAPTVTPRWVAQLYLKASKLLETPRLPSSLPQTQGFSEEGLWGGELHQQQSPLPQAPRDISTVACPPLLSPQLISNSGARKQFLFPNRTSAFCVTRLTFCLILVGVLIE